MPVPLTEIRRAALVIREQRALPDPDQHRIVKLGDELAREIRTSAYFWDADAADVLAATRAYQAWRRTGPAASTRTFDLLDNMAVNVLAEAAEAWAEEEKVRVAELRTADWPTVGGRKVEPYSLPEDPSADALEMVAMLQRARRERDLARTRFRRALARAVAFSKHNRGVTRELTIARRVTIELRRKPSSMGELFAVETYRAQRWNLRLEFWRAR